MPSLIDIRRRIRTVRNTQQLTKAMKMISAAKLRRTQERVVAARPYAAHLRALLSSLAAASAQSDADVSLPLLERREEKRIQLVLISADRGLAGAFNSNVSKASQRFAAERLGRQVLIEALGKKGRDYWNRRGGTVSGAHLGVSQKVQYASAVKIAQILCERYEKREIDAVYLIYNEFKSMLSQKVCEMRVLPVELPSLDAPVNYILENPPEQMLEKLLPRYVEVSLYQALLESEAAEHAARMTAMDAATTNAGDVIDKLTLHLNRVRQASITKEIIEVVSGAAAVM